ncbi:Nicotinamide-nucleotide amidase [hydrothermal vent metagenome]|uniref:Nicotinamide-nucleotide amidase n=1 Tax=hydrothermal vent metagenome TaxID=652676 RepID=A0A3B0Y4V5_9ZZZZ
MPDEVLSLVSELADRLLARGELLACAESCTGGWVAKSCTDLAGSSVWFERGFVTYSNAAKQEMLGVSVATLDEQGAVSEATVAEMAAGALEHSAAHWALAISGIAGPGGGSVDKPVGTVWIGWAGPGDWRNTERHHFDGGREAVRHQSVVAALRGLLDQLATSAN